jgi:hypothetical protein
VRLSLYLAAGYNVGTRDVAGVGRFLSRSVVIGLPSTQGTRKRQSGAGKIRFDCSSWGMHFRRNRTGLPLQQQDKAGLDFIMMDEITDDTKGGFRRVELLTGPGRRRRWSAAEKAQVVAAAGRLWGCCRACRDRGGALVADRPCCWCRLGAGCGGAAGAGAGAASGRAGAGLTAADRWLVP